ncbi:LysR family transcriptional regulator [Pseudomonas sp. LB-090624]|uniref:LysR family transcriptional regulator n=1 Tax=Pseudomonas sp. LB-090624 TaxID=2213079 RepID=UPI000D8DDBB1|nr:LysR family transcriptional regulator [Pseudomonas sp. LB-090624]PYB78903.1 LysR family transcriptional regulator [Pseudomonas sp. LB-090624]
MSNIKQIEAFYWTVKLGTLQRAAVKLFITQSAITKRIKELEKQASVSLFDTNAQKSALTGKGEELLVAAGAVLESLQQLDEMRASAQRTIRTIRIGISELATLTWFSRFVQQLNSIYPHIAVLPDVDISARLQQKMLAGELDLIVVPVDYVSAEMESLLIDSVDFTWLAPPGSFVDGVPVTVRELARLPVIIQGSQSGITTRIESLFAQAGVDFKKVFGSNSLFALAALIRAGVGVSCIPKILFEDDIESGLYQEVMLSSGVSPVDYHFAFMKHDQQALGYTLSSLARECVKSYLESLRKS